MASTANSDQTSSAAPARNPHSTQSEGMTMQAVEVVAYSIPWFAWIPIIAIVCASASGIIKMLIVHRERMAMIRMGIHPDAKHGEQKPYAFEEQEV
jgi:hypothetical protein